MAVKIVWSEAVYGLWRNVESVMDSGYSQKQWHRMTEGKKGRSENT